MATGRTVLVVAAAPIEITTYDAGGDYHHRRCPHGVATADVMMTMAGKKRARRWRGDSKAMVRQRRGNGEATARRLQGDYKATTRQQGCKGISYGAAGGRGNEAIDKRITKNSI